MSRPGVCTTIPLPAAVLDILATVAAPLPLEQFATPARLIERLCAPPAAGEADGHDGLVITDPATGATLRQAGRLVPLLVRLAHEPAAPDGVGIEALWPAVAAPGAEASASAWGEAVAALAALDPTGAGRRAAARAWAAGATSAGVFAAAAADAFWRFGEDRIWRAVGPDGGVVTASGATLAVAGRRLEDLRARSPAPDRVDRLIALMSDGVAFRDEIIRLHGDDGRERAMRIAGRPVRAADGRLLEWRGTIAEATQELDAKRVALSTQIRLNEAVESMPAAFLLFDTDDRLVLWNTRANALYPSAQKLLVGGARLLDLLAAAAERGDIPQALPRIGDWLAERMMATRSTGENRFDEATADGRWLSSVVRRISDGSTVMVVSDVTELKLKEAELRLAKDAAEQANMAKSRFLAAASHDLRQPLHAFGLLLSSLGMRVKDPEALRVIRRMEQALDSMQGMFNALLDVSRLDAGVLEPERRPTPLAPLLEATALEFAPVARDRGLTLRVPATSLWVDSDPVLLDRIVRNLVSNALRYTLHGGVLLGVRSRDGRVRIEVYDTGIGIAPEDRDAIFEEFRRLDPAIREARMGLGLGLAIVKRLSALLGHDIDLASRPGRGTRFAITLDRAAAVAAWTARPDALRLRIRRLAGRAIAVLDDEPLAVEGMQRALASWGCRSIAGATAEQLLQAVAATDAPVIDAAVVDYQLARGTTGLVAVTALRRQLGRALPVLLVTGSTDAPSLDAIRASGHPWLTKPVMPSALRGALELLLARTPRRPKRRGGPG